PDLRQLPRYHQIIGQNTQLLHNAYVLDLMSADGLWSLAALDAGAAYVVGVDPWPSRIAAAEQAFAGYGVPQSSYRFVNMDVMAALYDTAPEPFAVIMVRGILELLDARQLFAQLQYLRPRHVILDTALTTGGGPLIRYGWRDVRAEYPPE